MNSLKNSIITGIFFAVIVFAMSGCTKPSSRREDATVMPKIEGCEIQRYKIDPGGADEMETLYVVRCKDVKTASTSVQYRCGKNCTKKVTTITTVEGTPEDGSTDQE